MEIVETMLTSANFKDNIFQVKCTIFKAYFSSLNGTMSSKIYHIQATLELL